MYKLKFRVNVNRTEMPPPSTALFLKYQLKALHENTHPLIEDYHHDGAEFGWGANENVGTQEDCLMETKELKRKTPPDSCSSPLPKRPRLTEDLQ